MIIHLEGVAHLRNLFQHLAGPAAHGIRVVPVFHFVLLQQLLQLHAAVHTHGAVFLLDNLFLDLIMLVVDLADQFFQHVFHGDDAFRSAVLIQQDHQMGLRSPELLQQVADGQGGRRKDRLLHDTGDFRAPVMGHLVEILFVQDADNMVQVLMEHGNPGVEGLPEQLRGFLHRRGILNRRHVHAGRHDIGSVLVVELDGRADQLALILLDIALCLGFIDDGNQFFLNLALFLIRLDQLREQLPPQGKQQVQRPEQPHQNPDYGADCHGKLFRLLLGQRLGADLTQEQDQHGHHNRRDRRSQVLLALENEHGKKHRCDRGARNVDHIIPDQDRCQQGVIFLQKVQRGLRPFLPGSVHRLQFHPVGGGKSRLRRGEKSGKRNADNQGNP